jgi:hypothetical protein
MQASSVELLVERRQLEGLQTLLGTPAALDQRLIALHGNRQSRGECRHFRKSHDLLS